jgi:hypothetical protein
MMKVIRLSVVVLVLLLTLTIVVHAQEGQPAETATAGDVAVLLAPLVAAAAAIERIIEMLFDCVESWVNIFGTFLGVTVKYIKWAREEVNRCRTAVVDATPAERSAAERALENAEQRLEDWLKTEPYPSIKRALSVVLGIALGVFVALLGKLQIFKLLGINLVGLDGQLLTTVDIWVTGFIIGTGSAPVHSLIGILQNTKDAIDQARALAQGRSYEAVRKYKADGAAEALNAFIARLETEAAKTPEAMEKGKAAKTPEATDKAAMQKVIKALREAAPPRSTVEMERQARWMLR